jgi:hypothetical protein
MTQDYINKRRKLENIYWTGVNQFEAPPLSIHKKENPNKWLELFNDKSTAEIIYKWFLNYFPLKNERGETFLESEFYQMHCCDLQWAIDGGFCKTQQQQNSQQQQQNPQQQSTTVTQQQQRVETKPAPPFLRGGKQTVAAFQDWLDINYPGWAKGYPGGMMNRGKGYGEFNDVTEEQYNFRNYERLFKFLKSTTPKPKDPNNIPWEYFRSVEDDN